MKKYAIAVCLLLAALAVQAKGIQEDLDLTEEKARVSYALGMAVGSDLSQFSLELNYAAFTEGVKAAMGDSEEVLMDTEEALELVQAAFENAMNRQSAEMREKEITFLEENSALPDVSITESGLQYTVLEQGTGPKPAATDTVLVHYEGMLTDGTVFDSSREQEKPEEIPLDMVIPGWAEGIQLMNVGSKYRIFIPSNLAYGRNGVGQVIPPYSTLIFTIELIEIVKQDGE